jgi:hypothetical protein
VIAGKSDRHFCALESHCDRKNAIFSAFVASIISNEKGVVFIREKGGNMSVEDKILRRIRGKPVGWVFTPSHFLDQGSYGAVVLALKQICDRGRIRRLARGLYDNPKTHPKLGFLTPSAEQIVEAISTKEHTRIQPTGAYAANILGLSTQVPAKIVFLTDGPDKRLIVGNRTIELKNRAPSSMAGAGKISGLAIQALKYIGQKQFTTEHLKQLRQNLSNDQVQQLINDIPLAPAWIADVFRKLNEESISHD